MIAETTIAPLQISAKPPRVTASFSENDCSIQNKRQHALSVAGSRPDGNVLDVSINAKLLQHPVAPDNLLKGYQARSNSSISDTSVALN
jgi:hypothetical protein